MSARRVVVTGASGFVGRHLCERLVARGDVVHALVRRADVALPDGVVPVSGALDNERALVAAFAGATHVAHCAGRAHVLHEREGDPAEAFHRVNVDGTRRVAAAAATAGVRRVVALSSIGAVRTASERVVDDATAPAPDTPYGRSKLAGEEALFAVAARTGLEAVVLRPAMVYGPAMRGNPLRLFDLVARGRPLPLGGVRNRRSTCWIGHLVDAVDVTLDAPGIAGERFAVADAEHPSTPALVRAIADALGVRARLVPVPPRLFRLAGRAGDLLARLGPFPLTSDAVDRLLGSLEVDASRLERTTRWRRATSLADGLAATAAWYRRRTSSLHA